MDKISCLMLCYNMDRLDQLRQAIKCFYNQTCDNPTELIVLCNGTSEHFTEVKKIINDLNVSNKTIIEHHEKNKENLSIGDLRNIAIELSSGDIIVSWDDDDLNHPMRLQEQYVYMISNDADVCFFSDHFHYFYGLEKMFWVNWGYEIPNTMMCKRKCFDNIKYPSMNHHEDSKLSRRIRNNYKSCILEKKGYLFTYCYTDSSIFGYDHHMNNIVMDKDLSLMSDLKLKLKSIYYMNGYEQEYIKSAEYMNPNHPLLAKV